MAEMVELGFKETAPLPQVIKIPVALMAAHDLPRYYTIKTPDQVVPAELRDWMANHRDHKKWFAEGEVVAVDVESVDETEVSADESEEDTPVETDNGDESEEETPVETDDEEDIDFWTVDFDSLTIAQMRDLASVNDINLKGATLRDDIIEILTDVRGD